MLFKCKINCRMKVHFDFREKNCQLQEPLKVTGYKIGSKVGFLELGPAESYTLARNSLCFPVRVIDQFQGMPHRISDGLDGGHVIQGHPTYEETNNQMMVARKCREREAICSGMQR